MKKFIKNQKIEAVVNALLIFLLAMCVTAFSLSSIVRFTVFNSAFITDSLNESDFYAELRTEVRSDLVSIGDASGFDRSFFDDFVDDILVREDVQAYIDDFYAGAKLTVNTKRFENKLRDAIQSYELSKGIKTETVDPKNVEYFISEASKVYSKGIEISYFKSIQKDFLKQIPKVTIIMIVSAVLAAGIIVLLILGQRWKHKAVRRIYYGFAASGLFMLLIPVVVFASGVIEKLVIFPTVSAREMYITLLNTFFTDVLTIAITLLVIAGALCVTTLRMRNKARE